MLIVLGELVVDLIPAPGMRTVEVAHYAYDSTGRLRAAWDPRLDWSDTSLTPPVTRHVQTTYAYDSNGILTTLTPPAQEHASAIPDRQPRKI